MTIKGVSAAAAKSLQSCPTLRDSIDGSPPGSAIPGILQAGTLEWVAVSFSNAWKWKCLQIFPNISWGSQIPPVENHCTSTIDNIKNNNKPCSILHQTLFPLEYYLLVSFQQSLKVGTIMTLLPIRKLRTERLNNTSKFSQLESTAAQTGTQATPELVFIILFLKLSLFESFLKDCL